MLGAKVCVTIEVYQVQEPLNLIRELLANLPNFYPRGDISFNILNGKQNFPLPQRGMPFLSFKLFAVQTSLKRQSKIKAVPRHAETEGSTKTCLSTVPTSFYTLLTSGEFFRECATLLVTLTNLTERDWDQIHSICLIWHLIKVTINRTPNSMRKLICSIDLSHASPRVPDLTS